MHQCQYVYHFVSGNVNTYAFKVLVGGVQAYVNRHFSRGRNAMDKPSRNDIIEKVKWCVGIYRNWDKVCLKYTEGSFKDNDIRTAAMRDMYDAATGRKKKLHVVEEGQKFDEGKYKRVENLVGRCLSEVEFDDEQNKIFLNRITNYIQSRAERS